MTYSDNFVHPDWDGEVAPNEKLNDAVLFLMEMAYDNIGALHKDEKGKNFKLDDDDDIYVEYILDVLADSVWKPLYYPIAKGGKRNCSNWIRSEHDSDELEEFFCTHSNNFWDYTDDYPEEYWSDEYPEDPYDTYEKRNVKFPCPMPADIFVGNTD